MQRVLIGIVATCAVFSAQFATAQQSVPFRGSIPIAPNGIPVPPLPREPVEYQTAEGQDIRVVVLARGLDHPWGIVFLPDGDMLVTQRSGQLRRISGDERNPDRLQRELVEGVPPVRAQGLSGLMDILLHPKFESNAYVYLSYQKPLTEETSSVAIARARWDGKRLVGTEDIFIAGEGSGGAARMAFGPDGMLYTTSGGNDPQDPASLGGKVLRLRDDGGVPDDNPFVGINGYRPEIYSLGHRNAIGLAFHPGTGELWQNENGPNGGDEINIIRPGANYGWPLVSLGRSYPGPLQSSEFSTFGFVDPVVYWTPSIAVSGMTFYTGDALPKWKGDVFVGGLRKGEIPGTGRVERILFNEQMQELRREVLLADLRQRVRDIKQGPDGLLYVLTDEDDGAVLRIEPGSSAR
jgi:glucose/arabinose dehydrogenase